MRYNFGTVVTSLISAKNVLDETVTQENIHWDAFIWADDNKKAQLCLFVNFKIVELVQHHMKMQLSWTLDWYNRKLEKKLSNMHKFIK